MFTIELTEAELQTLTGLIDAGVRATGLSCVAQTAGVLQKIHLAVEAFQQKLESKQPPIAGKTDRD
jgi:hypothetical protein